jgi:hypothetical protein
MADCAGFALHRQLSRRACNVSSNGPAGGTAGCHAIDGSVWVSNGCRANMSCASGKRLRCGCSVGEYLSPRRCSCGLLSDDDLAVTVPQSLRHWQADVAQQIRHHRVRRRPPPLHWGSVLRQWRLARRDLGLDSGDDDDEALALYLGLRADAPGVLSPEPNHVDCAVHTRDGLQLKFVQVYKCNTQAICGNLKELQRLQVATARAYRAKSALHVFSFVRHPVEHFVSGFTEIAYRATHSSYNQDRAQYACAPEERAWYSFVRRKPGTEGHALAFLRDFARGRMRAALPRDESQDVHAFPQMGFLASHASSAHTDRAVGGTESIEGKGQLGFVGALEQMHADWARLGTWAGADRSWPAFRDAGPWKQHLATNSSAHRAERPAMRRLLGDDRPCATNASLALHRMLLVDFVCLAALYPLPEACRAAIGPYHGVRCPVRLPLSPATSADGE